MQGSINIEASEKKLTDLTTPMKKWKKIHRKDRDNGEQERQTNEEKGIHELKKDDWGIKKSAGEGNHG